MYLVKFLELTGSANNFGLKDIKNLTSADAAFFQFSKVAEILLE